MDTTSINDLLTSLNTAIIALGTVQTNLTTIMAEIQAILAPAPTPAPAPSPAPSPTPSPTPSTTAQVSLGASQGGSINQPGGTQTLQKGTFIVLTATPDNGYKFLYWNTSWGVQIPDNPYAIIVSDDISVTAMFQAVT